MVDILIATAAVVGTMTEAVVVVGITTITAGRYYDSSSGGIGRNNNFFGCSGLWVI